MHHPHPPKPFTPEWCKLHPGQGQCPDDIVSVPIDGYVYQILVLIAITIFWIIFKYRKQIHNFIKSIF